MWIDIARVTIVGAVLGLIIGKITAENPRYIRAIHPRFWIASAKKASQRKWMRFISLSIFFAIMAFFLIGITSNLIATEWTLYSEKEYIFVRIAKISFPLLLVTVTILPILEEWIFRGIILEEFARRMNSEWGGLILSSIVFGLFHLSNPGTFPAAVIPLTYGGLILGGSYLSGGLATAALCHSLYNVLLLIPLII